MRESPGRQLASSSIGFSRGQAEGTGPVSLEDKETRVPEAPQRVPVRGAAVPALCPRSEGRQRGMPAEAAPSGPQEGISSKSAGLAQNPQFQVAKPRFLPSPMKKAGDGKATIYVSSPLAGCLLGQSLMSLRSGVRMRPPTGLAEAPGRILFLDPRGRWVLGGGRMGSQKQCVRTGDKCPALLGFKHLGSCTCTHGN